VLPFIETRLGAKPPRIGLLGTSRVARALRLAYKFPNGFQSLRPSRRPSTPKRYNEGDETIPQMYPDPEAAAKTRPSCTFTAELAETSILLLRPGRPPLVESADRLRMKLYSWGPARV